MKVWEKAHQLALALYEISNTFPREETYGLVSQIRRAASSIPCNIAEGCGRDGDPELARFWIIARGSASELEYQLLLARDLKLMLPQDYEKLSEQTVEIKRMLTVLVQKLKALNADSARPAESSTLVAASGRARRLTRGTASMAAPFRGFLDVA